MIKVFVNTIWILFSKMTLAIIFPSCSERLYEPVVMPDSTIVFPAKDTNNISAKIMFSRFIGQKSGRQWAISDVFPLKENENVYAVINLDNRHNFKDNELMFHIDWVGPDGKSVYLKRIDLPAGDSISALVSSISIEPGKRQSGNYMIQVYLFRELIAEKNFTLVPDEEMKKVFADIIFYKIIDKETGEMKGVDTSFEIKKKGILRAQVNLTNLDVYEDEELPFRMEWSGPDGGSFYSKKIDLIKGDSVPFISSSISITPDKREPGEYYLRVYLFDEMVGEKSFVLKPSE
jgi:hypothetical protein